MEASTIDRHLTGKQPGITKKAIRSLISEMAAESDHGRRLDVGDRVATLRKLVEHGAVISLDKLLPALLQLNGIPYTLDDYRPFESLYRTIMPKSIVYKTGRQVAKTTNLAAHGIMLATSLANHKTLYVTPLYEQIRRFSNNYVRPFINNSPLRGFWTGTTTESSVLQRSFRNGSMMLFSFALTDTDRIRGVSCQKVAIDESVRYGTLVLTRCGSTPIEQLTPGSHVYGIDEHGNRQDDEVLTNSDHGTRDCYRIELDNGHALECTSESLIATTAGWRSVSTLIEELAALAGADAPGNNVGRCLHADDQNNQGQSAVPEQPRLGSERLQHGQVPGIARVLESTTREEDESRLRRMVELLADQKLSRVSPDRVLVSPPGPKASHTNLARPDDLGSRGLVVHGRWESAGLSGGLQHPGLLSDRSRTPGFLADAARYRSLALDVTEPTQSREAVSHHQDFGRSCVPTDRAHPAVDRSGDAVQDCIAGTTHDASLSLLRAGVLDTAGPRSIRDTEAALLLGSGLSNGEIPGEWTAVPIEARPEGDHQSTTEGAACCGRCRATREDCPLYEEVSASQSGEGQSNQTASLSETTSQPTGSYLQAMQPVVCVDGSQDTEVLSGLPQGCLERDCATVSRKHQDRTTNQTVPRVLAAVCGQQQCAGVLHTTMQSDVDQSITAGQVCAHRANLQALQCLSVAVYTYGWSTSYVRPGQVQETATQACDTAAIVGISWTGRHPVRDITTKRFRTFFAGGIAVHNCQDMDPAHIPIIMECLSAAKHLAQVQFTGTSKTLDNTLQAQWTRSSQAEWFIPCLSCNQWNIPAKEYHLEKMIGPLHHHISEKYPGTICFNCRKPISPRYGRWVHRYPDRRWLAAGYHIPQIILPLHYASVEKWSDLLRKQQGWGNTTQAVFWNEVMGEAVDTGQKLLTETDMKAACRLPYNNNLPGPDPRIKEVLSKYTHRMLAIDWGGGGETEVSFTVLSLLGFKRNGQIDVLWGKRLLLGCDHLKEAAECIKWFNLFKCHSIAHDYTGAGDVRETVLIQAGLNPQKIFGVRLARTGNQDLMLYHPPTTHNHHAFYTLDKARSLTYTANAIKLGQIAFFQWDFRAQDNPGLISDFLALMENKTETRLAGDVYTIIRNPMLSDDFAQATNIGCSMLWQMHEAWPNFANLAGVKKLTNSQIEAAGTRDWGWESDPMAGQFFNMP